MRNMSLQEEMFSQVDDWQSSGKTKVDFLKDKPIGEAKFNYWIAKWKANRAAAGAGFREIGFSKAALEKVLEIETPSGYKISVFA